MPGPDAAPQEPVPDVIEEVGWVGGENIHDQLDPEMSAQVLKQHVADGIDVAYAARLPKALIAYIPQHHGTAIMSYFYARARGRAAEPYGGLETAERASA